MNSEFVPDDSLDLQPYAPGMTPAPLSVAPPLSREDFLASLEGDAGKEAGDVVKRLRLGAHLQQ